VAAFAGVGDWTGSGDGQVGAYAEAIDTYIRWAPQRYPPKFAGARGRFSGVAAGSYIRDFPIGRSGPGLDRTLVPCGCPDDVEVRWLTNGGSAQPVAQRRRTEWGCHEFQDKPRLIGLPGVRAGRGAMGHSSVIRLPRQPDSVEAEQLYYAHVTALPQAG